MRKILLVLLLWGCSVAAGSPVSLFAGYEARYDEFRYQFANPSRFNTPFLVPHTFEQTYSGTNHWANVAVGYKLAGFDWQTQFGLSLQRTIHGEDFDTFFQPNNDVVVSGTSGDVSIRSFRFIQTAGYRLQTFTFQFHYTLRRDRMDFLPCPFFQTHTNPPQQVTGFISDPSETTTSLVHEFSMGGSKTWPLSRRWAIRASGYGSPIVLAYLTTVLRKKYPGQEFQFLAKGVGLSGEIALTIARLQFYLDYSGTWTFSDTHRYHRTILAPGLKFQF